MIPQGSEIFNTQQIAALTTQVSAAASCADLQNLATDSIQSLLAYEDAINSQLAELAPMLALLTAPTSPTAVVTWVENYITNLLTPYLKPYVTYGTQLTEIAAQLAALEAAITSKAAEFTSCTITIPTSP